MTGFGYGPEYKKKKNNKKLFFRGVVGRICVQSFSGICASLIISAQKLNYILQPFSDGCTVYVFQELVEAIPCGWVVLRTPCGQPVVYHSLPTWPYLSETLLPPHCHLVEGQVHIGA